MESVMGGGKIATANPVRAQPPNAAKPSERPEASAPVTGRAVAEIASGEIAPEEALQRLREVLVKIGELPEKSDLIISRDDESGRFIYEFRNPETGETERRFPAQTILKAVTEGGVKIPGVLLNRNA